MKALVCMLDTQECLIPTVYLANQGAGRANLYELGRDVGEKAVSSGEMMAEVWGECMKSANCREIGDERLVFLNVQCLKYIQ